MTSLPLLCFLSLSEPVRAISPTLFATETLSGSGVYQIPILPDSQILMFGSRYYKCIQNIRLTSVYLSQRIAAFALLCFLCVRLDGTAGLSSCTSLHVYRSSLQGCTAACDCLLLLFRLGFNHM